MGVGRGSFQDKVRPDLRLPVKKEIKDGCSRHAARRHVTLTLKMFTPPIYYAIYSLMKLFVTFSITLSPRGSSLLRGCHGNIKINRGLCIRTYRL